MSIYSNTFSVTPGLHKRSRSISLRLKFLSKLSKYRLTRVNLLVACFSLFSFTTFTYRLWPSFFPINRLLGFVIIILVASLYISIVRLIDIVILLSVLIVSTVSIFQVTWSPSQNVNDAIYWAITVLALMKLSSTNFCGKLSDSVSYNKPLIRFVAIIDNIIAFVGLFFEQCYSGAWDGRYYIGFAYSEHTLSCAACMCLGMSLFFINDFKHVLSRILFMIPCSIAIVQSGARTYLFPLLIIWIFLFQYRVKDVSIKLVLIPTVIIAATYFLMNSSFMQKMTFTANNTYTSSNQMTSFTSGRTDFWSIDLREFTNADLFHFLFGQGFDRVYFINKSQYGLTIWAHNDFINTLLCNGIFGFCIYTFVIINLFFFLKIKIGTFNAFLVISYYFIVAFINGLFGYQHYLYSFIFIFLAFYIEKNYQRQIK